MLQPQAQQHSQACIETHTIIVIFEIKVGNVHDADTSNVTA